MQNVIIDLEFTGLDNTYMKQHEIIQLKMMNCETELSVCENYGSTITLSAYSYLHHKVKRYAYERFGSDLFLKALERIGVTMETARFWGWGVSQDLLMLKKYGLTPEIADLREQMQLTRFEKPMALGGSGLEPAYYLLTKKIPKLKNHDGIEELNLIFEIYQQLKPYKKRKYLTVMPHGHCAGMPLNEYVADYRKAADGYRFNNNDLLALSLYNAIEQLEEVEDEDY